MWASIFFCGICYDRWNNILIFEAVKSIFIFIKTKLKSCQSRTNKSNL